MTPTTPSGGYGAIVNPDVPLIQSSVSQEQRRKRRDMMKKNNAQKSRGGVFKQVFTSKMSSSTMASERNSNHSWVYTMLNPRSNQPHALHFKSFIVSIILIDLIFFIVSTEPSMEGNEVFRIAEGCTSTIFLIEYIARLWVIMESRYYRDLGPIMGRLKYMFTNTGAIVDALATFPFFIELFTGLNLPTLTYVRVFRLLRILKTQAYSRAFDALWRVFYYNREIMQVAGLVCIFLVVLTAVLMYYLRPPDSSNVDGNFSSIGSTMFIATLMLTGQGGPDADNLPWYTKAVVLLTGIFSVAVFAIPASMLTWGFEAEAERLAAMTRRKRKLQSTGESASSSSSEWMSSDGDSTDEEYQKIIAGADDDDGPTEEEKMQKLLAVFKQADVDSSGGLNAEEFIQYLKDNMESVSDILGVGGDDNEAPIAADKSLSLRVQKLEDKMDTIVTKLDQVLAALAK